MAENVLRQRMESLLDNPNVQRYQFGIRSAEHGDKVKDADRYSRAFGNRVIADLSKYNSDFKVPFKETNGRTNYTSAQGAYQFINPTWERVARVLGLTDFSPRSQDIAALYLMYENGSLADVQKGDFAAALNKDGKTWASLPTSKYPQPRQSVANMARWLGVPDLKSDEAGSPGSFNLADGRSVTGKDEREHNRLMDIYNSPHSDATKTKMVDVLAQMPKLTNPKDLFSADLPSTLDKELMQLIDNVG